MILLEKRIVLILLVFAVVLSVVATWKVLTTSPGERVVWVQDGRPQHGDVGLRIGPEEDTTPAGVQKGAPVSLFLEKEK